MLPLLPFALLLAILPFPGTVALRLICLVAAAALAFFSWRKAANRPVIPCKPALALWIFLAALSVAYSAIPGYSLGEFKNEIGYTMLAFISFLVIANKRETVQHLLVALAAGFTLIGVWAACAWAANGFIWDQSGRYGGIAVFSTYIVTVVPALFCLACAGSRPWLRRAAWLLLGLAFLLALMTLQRAVWPALLAEVAVIGFWRYRKGMRSGLVMTAIAVIVIASSFYATSSLRSETLSGMEESVEASLAGDTRLAAWRGIVAKIAEHPWAGAGFGRGTMGRVYPELIPENKMISHPHNVFLNYGIAMGIPGILALAVLFFCLARIFWRQRAEEGLAIYGVCGVALIVGVVIRNQFNDLFIRDMALLYWALIGIFLGQAAHLKRVNA